MKVRKQAWMPDEVVVALNLYVGEDGIGARSAVRAG
jgi:hypothetical protein